MTLRAPCVRCGSLLHTGQGRIVVTFTVEELVELAIATNDNNVRARLLCAIGLLNAELEAQLRAGCG